jgi:hypothetical protein
MSIKPFLLSAVAVLLLFCSGCIKNLPATNTQGKTLARALTAASSSPITYSFNLPMRVAQPFIWGVNGHPLYPGAYYNNVRWQMGLLKELQAPWYRVDFNPNPDNSGYFTSSPYASTATALFAAAADSGVNILPIIIWDSAHVRALTPANAYADGVAAAQSFMTVYGGNFPQHYYEVANEEDLRYGWSIWNQNSGNFPLQNVICNYFKGMIAGVKAADPQAKIIINSGGNPLFFAYLANYQVQYDIIGYDNYQGESALSTDLGSLSNYGKDIWLTEINNYQTAKDLPNNTEASAIDDELEACDQQPVKAIFFYELLNEDGQTGGQDPSTLGLIKWNHYQVYNPQDTTIKDIFEKYKFKIEETDLGWYDFAYATFIYCDFRQPDPGGLQSWTNWFTSNRNIPEAFNILLPQENYLRWVDQQFELLLGRAADPSGESWWTQQLVNGATRESVIETFVGGAEFWALSQSSNDGLINRAYNILMKRPPTGAEEVHWYNGLENGSILPWQVAQGILADTGYQRLYVTNLYNTVLNTTPSASTVSGWVGLMQSGMNQLDVFKSLLNRPEFYQQAIIQGYNRNHPGYTY